MSLIILSTDDASTVTLDELTPHSEAWARELVAARWLVAWPLQVPTCVGILEREPSDLPGTGAYAACSFRYLDGRQATLGRHPRIHHRAAISVRIWTPDGEGGSLASQLADSARTVYNLHQLTSAPTIDALYIQAGETPTSVTLGKWHQQTLTWPCYWYEQRQ